MCVCVCVFLFSVYPFLAERPLMSRATVFVPGKSPLWATDFRPYTTLMYGNGPGYKKVNGSRPDLSDVDTSKARYSCCGRDPSSEHQQSVIVSAIRNFGMGLKCCKMAITRKQFPPKKLNWGDL